MAIIISLLIIAVVAWKPSFLTDNQHALAHHDTMYLAQTNWLQFALLIGLTLMLLLVI